MKASKSHKSPAPLANIFNIANSQIFEDPKMTELNKETAIILIPEKTLTTATITMAGTAEDVLTNQWNHLLRAFNRRQNTEKQNQPPFSNTLL